MEFIYYLIIGLLILYIVYLLHQLKDVNKQLNNRKDLTNISPLKTMGINSTINELIAHYNQLLFAYQTLQAEYFVASENVKQMTSSISHDFRTPLTSMKGYIQLIREDLDNPRNLERLSIIEKRIIDLNQNVEDFYMLSLLDSKEYPLDIERISILSVLKEFIASYYEDLDNHFDNLDFDIQEDRIYVLGDELTYKRIFGNLLRNALQHGYGQLSIQTNISRNTLYIRISNDAVIDIPEISDIFKRNFRAEKSRNQMSTGLGLAITKELLELVEASIDVEQVNNRLIFEIRVPILPR